MKYHPLKKHSPIPLYVQVANVIKRNIREGVLKEGALIPSESQLMKAYQISRITVRNALLRLEHDGEIFKVQGRGSFVADRDPFVITSPFLFFKEEMNKLGIDVSTQLVEFLNVYPTERVRSELKLKPGEMVTKVKRLIKVGSQSIGVRTLFLPLDIGEDLKGKDLTQISLLTYLNSNPQTRIARMEVRIQAAAIGDGDAEVMDVNTDNTVMVRGVIFWSHSGRPVMSGRVVYLAQHAIFKMQLNTDSVPSDISIGEIPARNSRAGLF